MAAKIRYYLDENVPIQVATQLKLRGIDVATVRDLGTLGASDHIHLVNATADDRVLCTNDSDFLQMVADGSEHSGIVFGQQSRHYIGAWVRFLTLLHAVYAPDEMRNRIEYL